jgi:putative ABC transport system substrate-binding protein
LESVISPVHDESEFEDIFAAHALTPNTGFVLIPDGFLNVHRVKITELAARYRLPTVYPWRFFPEVGGLLSYGADQRDEFQLAATYVDRILKGEKPGELPVQAPVKFELVINLRTAKHLGLDVSAHLQQLADEIIE